MDEVELSDLSVPLIDREEETDFLIPLSWRKLNKHDKVKSGVLQNSYRTSAMSNNYRFDTISKSYRTNKDTIISYQSKMKDYSDTDSDDEKFYFKSSINAGSNFLQILDDEGKEIDNSELRMFINEEDAKESGSNGIQYASTIILK